MPVLTTRVNLEIHRSFKLWCVRRDRKMSDVIRRLVLDWVAEQERLDRKVLELEHQEKGETE